MSFGHTLHSIFKHFIYTQCRLSLLIWWWRTFYSRWWLLTASSIIYIGINEIAALLPIFSLKSWNKANIIWLDYGSSVDELSSFRLIRFQCFKIHGFDERLQSFGAFLIRWSVTFQQYLHQWLNIMSFNLDVIFALIATHMHLRWCDE